MKRRRREDKLTKGFNLDEIFDKSKVQVFGKVLDRLQGSNQGLSRKVINRTLEKRFSHVDDPSLAVNVHVELSILHREAIDELAPIDMGDSVVLGFVMIGDLEMVVGKDLSHKVKADFKWVLVTWPKEKEGKREGREKLVVEGGEERRGRREEIDKKKRDTL